MNHLVYIQFILFGRHFLYESADPSYNGAGTSPICNDFFESTAQNVRFEIMLVEQSQARIAVIGYGRQRLVDFMRYGCCQFAHGCQP